MHSKSPSGIPIPVLKIANGKIVTGSTPPNTPRQATWITDAHFHATNYTQQGYKPAQLLTAMDALQIRYTVLSPIPTNQIACCSSKTYRPAHGVANDQPNYYIYDPDVRAARFVTAEVYKYIIKQSPSLVYNTGVDAYTAVSYGVLPDKDKDRFDPMVTGLVLGDDRASDDLMFKMQAFPGVFTGVGEITVHKEWVERKLSGDVQANLKDRAPALKFLFQTCGDIGMPVILHCDADVMPHERTKDTPEHEVSLKELMGEPCEALIQRQSLQALSAALQELPQSTVDALMLVAVDGLSHEEAAALLGVSAGTVRSRVSRARAALRKRFGTTPITEAA